MHITRAVLKTVVVITLLVGGNNVCSVASADQPDLISEFSTALGFTKNQVFDASISDNSTLKLSVDECSFCGAFKNEDTRNRIARASLEWLLSKTGGKTGTVEWYNRGRVKIMTISGSREQSEITSGLPCAIKKQ
jgi:hypothetical protein